MFVLVCLTEPGVTPSYMKVCIEILSICPGIWAGLGQADDQLNHLTSSQAKLCFLNHWKYLFVFKIPCLSCHAQISPSESNLKRVTVCDKKVQCEMCGTFVLS